MFAVSLKVPGKLMSLSFLLPPWVDHSEPACVPQNRLGLALQCLSHGVPRLRAVTFVQRRTARGMRACRPGQGVRTAAHEEAGGAGRGGARGPGHGGASALLRINVFAVYIFIFPTLEGPLK